MKEETKVSCFSLQLFQFRYSLFFHAGIPISRLVLEVVGEKFRISKPQKPHREPPAEPQEVAEDRLDPEFFFESDWD